MLHSNVAAAIEAWAPARDGENETSFSRRVVADARPPNAQRAKALLFAAGRLASFAVGVGLPLEEEVLFRDGVIERFISTARLSDVTRRTLRANLRFLARAVLAHPPPAPLPLPRSHAKRPYSSAEIASYLALCDAQPTVARRHRLGALVCLGAGAGLMGAELRSITGHDICARSGGVVATVGQGRRPRAVPVLSGYHDRLVSAARFAGERYVIGGVDPARANVTDRLVRVALSTSDLPRLDTGRLRSTYLVAMAEAIGLRAFMDAAGIICSQRLGDLVAYCSPVGEEAAVAILRGRH